MAMTGDFLYPFVRTGFKVWYPSCSNLKLRLLYTLFITIVCLRFCALSLPIVVISPGISLNTRLSDAFDQFTSTQNLFLLPKVSRRLNPHLESDVFGYNSWYSLSSLKYIKSKFLQQIKVIYKIF